jgi:hypothetical protein
MSTAPKDWLARVLTWSLTWSLVVFAVALAAGGGCGRTDFDTGSRGDAGTLPTGLAGLPSTPGIFICGSSFCATATQQCCLGLSSSGALSASCLPLAASCGGASLQCDEPADCTSISKSQSNVCCAGVAVATGGALPVSLGSQCVAATQCAGTGHFTVCRVDGDCPRGSVCCAGDGVPTCLATCPKI